MDKNKYIIVVSHQPTDLEKNSKLGYNLQISGHTHNGQIFPFNLLIKFFNLAELIYGQKEFENFNVIVTSGLSGWGYPIRTAGNSDILADYFLKGAEESQNIVEKVFLVNKKIEFCKGCLSCQNTGKCIIKDDANEIIEKIKNSDVVVFSTPIYFYEMAGQMKTLLDRTNPL